MATFGPTGRPAHTVGQAVALTLLRDGYTQRAIHTRTDVAPRRAVPAGSAARHHRPARHQRGPRLPRSPRRRLLRAVRDGPGPRRRPRPGKVHPAAAAAACAISFGTPATPRTAACRTEQIEPDRDGGASCPLHEAAALLTDDAGQRLNWAARALHPQGDSAWPR
ncbi:hypothetical protein ACF07S_26650 [Streptomyces sp. NPDC016640]|uniref:hypothetical protein n=1 Tax=Streptomyces sp. NPDC016640 TaxID=3364969 RepID=UPI003702EDE6